MDIILALLPWRIVLTLTLNKKEKIGVLLAMSMGILCVPLPLYPLFFFSFF